MGRVLHTIKNVWKWPIVTPVSSRFAKLGSLDPEIRKSLQRAIGRLRSNDTRLGLKTS